MQSVNGLTAAQTHPAWGLAIVRGHWRIENQLFNRRDITFGENYPHTRYDHAPEVLAAITSIVIGLLVQGGFNVVVRQFR